MMMIVMMIILLSIRIFIDERGYECHPEYKCSLFMDTMNLIIKIFSVFDYEMYVHNWSLLEDEYVIENGMFITPVNKYKPPGNEWDVNFSG